MGGGGGGTGTCRAPRRREEGSLRTRNIKGRDKRFYQNARSGGRENIVRILQSRLSDNFLLSF